VRLGEGLSKGTLAGAEEDLERLLDVLPETKIVRAMSAASMVVDVARMAEEAATTNDPRKAAQIVGTLAVTAAFAFASKGKKKKRGDKVGDWIEIDDVDNSFRRKYVSKYTLGESERRSYKRRVQELHSALGTGGVGRKTTAVIIARDPKTRELITIVSSSDEIVPKAIREKMRKNEIPARGGKKANPDSPYDHANHAEVN
jgi:hypothetical protein